MAHLLYKWINEDVVLTKKVTNFAKDFQMVIYLLIYYTYIIN